MRDSWRILHSVTPEWWLVWCSAGAGEWRCQCRIPGPRPTHAIYLKAENDGDRKQPSSSSPCIHLYSISIWSTVYWFTVDPCLRHFLQKESFSVLRRDFMQFQIWEQKTHKPQSWKSTTITRRLKLGEARVESTVCTRKYLLPSLGLEVWWMDHPN